MLKRNLQTLIWKYDKAFTDAVVLIPTSLQRWSAQLGHVTLPSIWAAITLVTTLTLLHAGYAKLATLGFVIVACIPIGSILKLLIRRARPKTIYAKKMRIKSYSFPSSHTYAATLAGGYLALIGMAFLMHPIGLIVATLLTLLIVVIGVSRIHVGAHYPTDVTAGWILGAIALYVAIKVVLP